MYEQSDYPKPTLVVSSRRNLNQYVPSYLLELHQSK